MNISQPNRLRGTTNVFATSTMGAEQTPSGSSGGLIHLGVHLLGVFLHHLQQSLFSVNVVWKIRLWKGRRRSICVCPESSVKGEHEFMVQHPGKDCHLSFEALLQKVDRREVQIGVLQDTALEVFLNSSTSWRIQHFGESLRLQTWLVILFFYGGAAMFVAASLLAVVMLGWWSIAAIPIITLIYGAGVEGSRRLHPLATLILLVLVLAIGAKLLESEPLTTRWAIASCTVWAALSARLSKVTSCRFLLALVLRNKKAYEALRSILHVIPAHH